jgi:hypothetical protein
MNIYLYLKKKDHKKVKGFLEQIMMVKSNQKREALFKEVSAEIQLQAQSEHDTFYKALKAHPESKEESQHSDK